ncbi:MAG: AsmA family protein, partial [Candidatus Latescibacteria bacterium]|nr:AsmA family protein [Candidatus Latescibacterota bacterium]
MKKSLIAMSLAVLLAVTLPLAILKLAYPPEYLKDVVLLEAGRRLKREIAIQDVSLQVLPSIGIRVSGVEVFEAEGAQPREASIRLGSFLMSLEILPLLNQQLVINEFVLSAPAINLLVTAEGSSLDGLFGGEIDEEASSASTAGEASALDVDVHHIRINDGEFNFKDSATGTIVEVAKIEINSGLTLKDNGNQLDFVGFLRAGTIRYSSIDTQVEDITCALDFDVGVDYSSDTIVIKNTTVSFNELPLLLNGDIEGFQSENPNYSLVYKSNALTLQALLAAIPEDIIDERDVGSGDGQISISGSVSGVMGSSEAPNIETDLTITDVRYDAPGLPVSIADANGDFSLNQGMIGLDGFSARLGRSDVAISASYGPIQQGASSISSPSLRAEISSQYLDLDELVPAVEEPEGPTPYEPMPDIAISAGFSGSKVMLRGIEMSDLKLTATAGDQILRLTDINARMYGGSFTGSIVQDLTDISKPAVQVDARMSELATGDIISEFLPIGKSLNGTLSSTISASTILDQLGNPVDQALNGFGDLAVSEGKIMNWPPFQKMAGFLKLKNSEAINFQSLTGGFRVDNGRLITPDLTMVGPVGKWNIEGSAGLDGSLSFAVLTELPA